MNAAVLVKPNQPLARIDLDLPDLQYGQVLVKVYFSGVCRSQLMEWKGMRGTDPHLPHLLGHEGSGVVQAIGPGVKKVAVNDRVVLTWIKGKGADSKGALFSKGTYQINSGSVTTFSNYSIVSENRLVRVPDSIPLNLAWLFGCALPTGCGIVKNSLRPAEGMTIAVFGLGGVGLCSLMASKIYKPKTLFAIDISPSKLKLAVELGATDCIDAKATDAVAIIRDRTSGVGVDYGIETSGQAHVIERAFESIRRGGGKLVFASHPEFGKKISLDPYELICGKKIEGSWGGGASLEEDIETFANWYLDGKLPLERLVSKTFSLDQVNEALKELDEGNIARVCIKMTHN